MCFVFIWEQTATCTTYSINWLDFITEMKSVYCAVRTRSLNKAVCASYLIKCCGKFTYSCAFHVYHNTSVREEWKYRLVSTSVRTSESEAAAAPLDNQHQFSNTQKDPWTWQWKCEVSDCRYVQRPAGNKVTSVDETKSDHTCWHFLQEESITAPAHKCAVLELVSSPARA